MKIFMYVLVAIGALALATIGGCACFAIFISKAAMDIPEYATTEYFSTKYGEDIQTITKMLRDEHDISYDNIRGTLHDDVVAIIAIKKDAASTTDSDDVDLYGRYHVVKGSGHTLWSSCGVARLKVDNVEAVYLVREIDVDERLYWICFQKKDHSTNRKSLGNTVEVGSTQDGRNVVIEGKTQQAGSQRVTATEQIGNKVPFGFENSEPARIWTNRKGKKVKAHLISINGERVELKSVKSGKIYKVKMSDFIEPDRAYITRSRGLTSSSRKNKEISSNGGTKSQVWKKAIATAKSHAQLGGPYSLMRIIIEDAKPHESVRASGTKLKKLTKKYHGGGGRYQDVKNGGILFLQHINSSSRRDGQDPIVFESPSRGTTKIWVDVPPNKELAIVGNVVLKRDSWK